MFNNCKYIICVADLSEAPKYGTNPIKRYKTKNIFEIIILKYKYKKNPP